MTIRPATIAAGASLLAAGAAAQPFDYNEFVDGDLSGDIAAPTDLGPTGLGTNRVRLTVENSAQPGGDFDVFTFRIQDGQELAALILEDYISADGIAFIAFDDAPTFPVDPNTGDPFAFAGGALFGTDIGGVGGDILPDLLAPTAGGSGFAGPVGPGVYTFFVQQTGEIAEAQLGFVIIPSPASASLLFVAGLAAVRRAR
jgi:hypothetical protein